MYCTHATSSDLCISHEGNGRGTIWASGSFDPWHASSLVTSFPLQSRTIITVPSDNRISIVKAKRSVARVFVLFGMSRTDFPHSLILHSLQPCGKQLSCGLVITNDVSFPPQSHHLSCISNLIIS